MTFQHFEKKKNTIIFDFTTSKNNDYSCGVNN